MSKPCHADFAILFLQLRLENDVRRAADISLIEANGTFTKENFMCIVCGCNQADNTHPAPGPDIHPETGDLHFGAGAARVSVPGMSATRAIKLEADVLGANNAVAAQNRAHFAAHGVRALNLVSSPGSGKTTLLCATIEALKKRVTDIALAVIEGDQQTSVDADRIRATGAPAIQINTGKGCHLDAPMVAQAFARLDLHAARHHHHGDAAPALLFIENVGNLVCPALWDLGEAAKVVILSVTEGEDKPLKYPDMFAAAQLMVLNKIDLLPYVSFDVARCREYVRRVNPDIQILELSASTGEGMSSWLDWLLTGPEQSESAALKARIAHLEAELAQLRATRG
jgi:hydrogenase nickel incorporation protein HypB